MCARRAVHGGIDRFAEAPSPSVPAVGQCVCQLSVVTEILLVDGDDVCTLSIPKMTSPFYNKYRMCHIIVLPLFFNR